MKKRRTRNTRLTSEKERRKQYIIKSVVKRGRRVTWRSISKWTVRCAKVVLLLALVGGIYWAGTEGYRRFFWENPDYALKEVRFNTDGAMTYEQVISTTGFVPDRNIFSYKLDTGREALLALPQVESVEMRRYLPSRIEITVTERKPVAWVTSRTEPGSNKTERSHLIDARGMVFHPKRVLPEYIPLPLIFGVPLDDLAPGKPVRVAEVVAALDLLKRVRESGDFQIGSVDVSKGYCIVVKNQKQTEITFALDDLPAQLHRLAEVQREAAKLGQDLKTVNVMIARNIPVTFMPPPEPEPDVDELLREPEKNAPRARVIGADPDARGGKATPKKPEPSKPKEPSRRESEPLLRPFRRV
jgi:cell division septal protein FtsQ